MRKEIIKFLTEAREGGWAKGVSPQKSFSSPADTKEAFTAIIHTDGSWTLTYPDGQENTGTSMEEFVSLLMHQGIEPRMPSSKVSPKIKTGLVRHAYGYQADNAPDDEIMSPRQQGPTKKGPPKKRGSAPYGKCPGCKHNPCDCEVG